MLPVVLKAQWNHVRFDQYNTFRTVYAVTANDAFVLGTDPWAGEYFFMRTGDGGQTWDSIAINNSATYEPTEMFFKDINNGFMGGYKNNATQALLRTTDNGTTWTEITPDPLSTEGITAIYFVNPLSGFAATSSKLYTTTNGGTSWTTQNVSFNISDMNFTTMQNGTACGTTNNSTAVMLKTADGGATWTPVFSATDPNFFVNNFLKQDIIGPAVIYTSAQYTNKLYKTLDGGATWDTITVDSVMTIHDFQFTTALIGHVLSDYGQIFVTLDGGQTWALEYATAWGFYGPSIYLYSISFVEETGYVVGTSGLIKKHEPSANAINELANSSNNLSVYPNPLAGSQDLFIQTKDISGDGKLQIVNAFGQIVFEKAIVDVQQNSLITLPGLNLASGSYYLNVETKENKSVRKFIVVE
jgi:photosystem II stability/assembly factor-like uncharacterized protein